MSHSISLDQAITMTQTFRDYRETLLAADYKGRDTLALSETFSKEAILALLVNPLCKSIRIYYGMDSDKKVHAILVGVDASDADILPATSTSEPSPMIVEQALRCPTICPSVSSALNS